jgi:hypothetical protein
MFKPSAARYCRGLCGEVRIRPYSAAALGIAVASVVIDTPSPNTEDDIAYYFSALAEFMCQGDVVQWQASSHRVDQALALEERAELGKAGVAIGSTQIVDEKEPKRDRIAH